MRQQSLRFQISRYIGNGLRACRGAADPIELGDILDGSFDHYFSLPEITVEVTAAGFEIAHFASSPYPHLVAHAR